MDEFHNQQEYKFTSARKEPVWIYLNKSWSGLTLTFLLNFSFYDELQVNTLELRKAAP